MDNRKVDVSLRNHPHPRRSRIRKSDRLRCWNVKTKWTKCTDSRERERERARILTTKTIIEDRNSLPLVRGERKRRFWGGLTSPPLSSKYQEKCKEYITRPTNSIVISMFPMRFTNNIDQCVLITLHYIRAPLECNKI